MQIINYDSLKSDKIINDKTIYSSHKDLLQLKIISGQT